MTISLYYFFCCIDTPKELPPSRLQVASTGSMIQYGTLRGFLVSRGIPDRAILWKVDKITTKIKNCALEQVPNDTKALLIENQISLAQDYLNISSPPSSFECTK